MRASLCPHRSVRSSGLVFQAAWPCTTMRASASHQQQQQHPALGSVASATSLPLPAVHAHGSSLRPGRRGAVQVHARGGRFSGQPMRGSPEVLDRVIACAPYVLPFLNAFIYGRFLYQTQPLVRACYQPLLPVITPFLSFPFANFIAFFAIYLGIAQNKQLSRFVRFNAIQAILLDILLVLPKLMEVIITPPMAGWGKQLYVSLNSTLWLVVTGLVLYGVVNSVLGQYGRIPFVAEAADDQIR